MSLTYSCPGKKGNTIYGTAALLRKMTVDLDTDKKVQEVMENETGCHGLFLGLNSASGLFRAGSFFRRRFFSHEFRKKIDRSIEHTQILIALNLNTVQCLDDTQNIFFVDFHVNSPLRLQ